MRNIYQDEASTRGSLEFSGQFSGLSYADGLLGYVRQGTLNNVYFVDQRLWMTSGFVQDDWKVTPKLTLNLGLRYDFATQAVEGKNHQANFDRSGAGSLFYAKDGSLEDRALAKVNAKNFAPRFGFAYSPDQKTVVRGGYGIYNLLFQRAGSENQVALNPPYLRQTTLTATATQPAFLLQNGFPPNFLDPANVDRSLTHIRAIDPNSATPYVQQWSVGLQRTLPAHLVFTMDYVGTKSTHFDLIHDLNQYVNGVKPYSNFAYLEYQQSLGNGSYNGLEASVQRRFTNGLSLDVAYTYSESIQTTYLQTFERALSGFDVPQRVVASYLYELPFGKGKPFVSTGTGGSTSWRMADGRRLYVLKRITVYRLIGFQFLECTRCLRRRDSTAECRRDAAYCGQYQLLVLRFGQQDLPGSRPGIRWCICSSATWTIWQCRGEYSARAWRQCFRFIIDARLHDQRIDKPSVPLGVV
jgi:hypothetical protein